MLKTDELGKEIGSAYIAHAADDEIRYKGTSGGVVSAMMLSLFRNNKIGSAISYEPDENGLFKPRIIYCAEQYNQVASIYVDTENYRFIKQNLHNFIGPVFITCLPCEAKAIRHIVKSAGLRVFIMTLFCSNQLTFNATKRLLMALKIKQNDVKSIRYRGKGWPSGVQIKTINKDVFMPNNNSLWMAIFHSHLYSLKKCYKCQDTIGVNGDFSAGDPWLDRYIKKDKVGSTMIVLNSPQAKEAFIKTVYWGDVGIDETIDINEVVESQIFTIRKKLFYRHHKKLVDYCLKLFRSKIYVRLMSLESLLILHYRVITKILHIVTRKI